MPVLVHVLGQMGDRNRLEWYSLSSEFEVVGAPGEDLWRQSFEARQTSTDDGHVCLHNGPDVVDREPMGIVVVVKTFNNDGQAQDADSTDTGSCQPRGLRASYWREGAKGREDLQPAGPKNTQEGCPLAEAYPQGPQDPYRKDEQEYVCEG
jgi:hypothetical protein